MKRAALIFGSFFLIAPIITPEDPRWTETEIVRLDAEQFPKVPESVRAFISAGGCLVPQPAILVEAGEAPANVVRGEFARKGQVDWAVLCSRSGVSSVLVLWGGPARCPTPIAAARDRDYMQVIHPGIVGFARGIAAVDPDLMRDTYETSREPLPEFALEHDAIDDAFLEKASTRHYCESGTWKRLVGSD